MSHEPTATATVECIRCLKCRRPMKIEILARKISHNANANKSDCKNRASVFKHSVVIGEPSGRPSLRKRDYLPHISA
jgi:hypothetical protein